jgi:hypothetical protein
MRMKLRVKVVLATLLLQSLRSLCAGVNGISAAQVKVMRTIDVGGDRRCGRLGTSEEAFEDVCHCCRWPFLQRSEIEDARWSRRWK